MMFGMVNHISPGSAALAESAQKAGLVVQTTAVANLELFHRSQRPTGDWCR